MELYKMQILYTLISIIVYLIIKVIINSLTKKYTSKHKISIVRKVIIIKTINGILTIIAIILLSIIWSVDPNEFFLFASSLLTILGIGLFAQWSILSNITSGIIMFFNNPVKLGANIKILDSDNDIEGTVVDIGVFFTVIQSPNNAKISVPNSIFLQKSILIKKE